MLQNLITDNKEHQRTFIVNEKIATVILLILLFVRLVDHNLPIWIFGVNIPNWFSYWYIGLAYILTVIIVWLNRHRLAALNIDRPFVIVLIISGFLHVFYLPADIGLLVLITTGFVYWAYQNNHFVLKNTIQYPSGTMLLISITLLLALLPILWLPLAVRKSLSLPLIISSLFQAQLALTVIEEVLFRGALWAFLLSLGLKENTAVLLQAFLFWMAHSKYLFDGNIYSFWVAVPLGAVLLGYMTWRSKSLMPSTTAHFLHNFATFLIKKLL